MGTPARSLRSVAGHRLNANRLLRSVASRSVKRVKPNRLLAKPSSHTKVQCRSATSHRMAPIVDHDARHCFWALCSAGVSLTIGWERFSRCATVILDVEERCGPDGPGTSAATRQTGTCTRGVAPCEECLCAAPEARQWNRVTRGQPRIDCMTIGSVARSMHSMHA